MTTEQHGKLNLLYTHVTSNLGITNTRFTCVHFLNKICQATDYNIEKAIKLFEEHMKMRQQYNVENMITEDWNLISQIRKFYPRQYYNTDLFGRPVLIEQVGKANFKEIFKVEFVLHRTSPLNTSRERCCSSTRCSTEFCCQHAREIPTAMWPT
jgi:hypothetical protein